MAEVSIKQAARTFAVLANPGRLQLLLALASEQICDVATLSRLTRRSQPYVSQQLRVLRDFGLVEGEPCRNRVLYRLSGQEVAAVLKAAGLAWSSTMDTETEVRQC